MSEPKESVKQEEQSKQQHLTVSRDHLEKMIGVAFIQGVDRCIQLLQVSTDEAFSQTFSKNFVDVLLEKANAKKESDQSKEEECQTEESTDQSDQATESTDQ